MSECTRPDCNSPACRPRVIKELRSQLAAKDAEIERLKDALDRQAAHYGGALSIEKARAEKAERERDLEKAMNEGYVARFASMPYKPVCAGCGAHEADLHKDGCRLIAAEARVAKLTRALERLELFLRDAKDCAKFIEHAQGMLAHAHGIAAAALAEKEEK